MKFNYKVIVPSPQDDGPPRPMLSIYGIGTYERSSVLAGQPMRVFLDYAETVEEAQALHPDAAEGHLPPRAEVPLIAPSWFDPMDAGEAWGEDDY